MRWPIDPAAVEIPTRHGEHWCGSYCRKIDIAAAREMAAYEQASKRHAAGEIGGRELAEQRFRLRVAMLAVDERAWPKQADAERSAIREDIASGLLVVPDDARQLTRRGSAEWRRRISEARRRPSKV